MKANERKMEVNYTLKVNESKIKVNKRWLWLEFKNLKLISKNSFLTSCSIIVKKHVLQLTIRKWQECVSLLNQMVEKPQWSVSNKILYYIYRVWSYSMRVFLQCLNLFYLFFTTHNLRIAIKLKKYLNIILFYIIFINYKLFKEIVTVPKHILSICLIT